MATPFNSLTKPWSRTYTGVPAGASSLDLTGIPVDTLRQLEVVKVGVDGGDLWITGFADTCSIGEDGAYLLFDGNPVAGLLMTAVDIKAHLAVNPSIGIHYQNGGTIYVLAHEEH